MKYPRLTTSKKEVTVFTLANGGETLDVEVALSEHFDRLLDSAGASTHADREEIADILASDAKLVEALWQSFLDAHSKTDSEA